MFFDTFFIFLNVLEQFAIRVTIFWVEIDLDDLINYVNKLYFTTNDDFIKNLIEESDNKNIDPKLVIKQSLKDIDRKIINDDIFNQYASEKLTYVKDIHFRYIY